MVVTFWPTVFVNVMMRRKFLKLSSNMFWIKGQERGVLRGNIKWVGKMSKK